MELFSPEFFSALLAIIFIDLVLAGDNAIVIAMAARNLPSHLQKKAIIWGAIGAIAVRSAMTIAVVYLLKIPGLMLVGGLLLVWIAYKLLIPSNDEADGGKHASTTFWGAMKTIIIADAVMGLDNVLAVAGASHGSFVLVLFGLLVSIPIVIWGSTQILKLVERFPFLVYLGAGVLAWTAAKMIIAEPMIQELQLFKNPIFEYASQALVIIGVLGAGYFRNSPSKDELSTETLVAPEVSEIISQTQGAKNMNKILIPVSNTSNAMTALRYAVNTYGKSANTHFHVCNVQPKLHRHIGKYFSPSAIKDWQQERANKELKFALQYLEKSGVLFSSTVVSGEKGDAIYDEAVNQGCNRIIIGSAKKNIWNRLFESSITTALLEKSNIPVEVITGRSLTPLERWGVPAIGAGATIALMSAVID